MANTGEAIGVNYPTLMPDLTDIADIQQAYQMYHIGIADWNGIDPPAADSIEGHFSSVNARAQALEDRPVAGGQVSPTEPTVVGPASLPVPDGYIWVDEDDTSASNTAWPTVIYSPTEPTLGPEDVGTLWIDEDGTEAVLNVNDYLTKVEATSTYETISAHSTSITAVQDAAAAASFMLMGA